MVGPPLQGKGRAIVKFIPVGSDDEPIFGIRFNGKKYQAHGIPEGKSPV